MSYRYEPVEKLTKPNSFDQFQPMLKPKKPNIFSVRGLHLCDPLTPLQAVLIARRLMKFRKCLWSAFDYIKLELNIIKSTDLRTGSVSEFQFLGGSFSCPLDNAARARHRTWKMPSTDRPELWQTPRHSHLSFLCSFLSFFCSSSQSVQTFLSTLSFPHFWVLFPLYPCSKHYLLRGGGLTEQIRKTVTSKLSTIPSPAQSLL